MSTLPFIASPEEAKTAVHEFVRTISDLLEDKNPSIDKINVLRVNIVEAFGSANKEAVRSAFKVLAEKDLDSSQMQSPRREIGKILALTDVYILSKLFEEDVVEKEEPSKGPLQNMLNNLNSCIKYVANRFLDICRDGGGALEITKLNEPKKAVRSYTPEEAAKKLLKLAMAIEQGSSNKRVSEVLQKGTHPSRHAPFVNKTLALHQAILSKGPFDFDKIIEELMPKAKKLDKDQIKVLEDQISNLYTVCLIHKDLDGVRVMTKEDNDPIYQKISAIFGHLDEVVRISARRLAYTCKGDLA